MHFLSLVQRCSWRFVTSDIFPSSINIFARDRRRPFNHPLLLTDRFVPQRRLQKNSKGSHRIILTACSLYQHLIISKCTNQTGRSLSLASEVHRDTKGCRKSSVYSIPDTCSNQVNVHYQMFGDAIWSALKSFVEVHCLPIALVPDR